VIQDNQYAHVSRHGTRKWANKIQKESLKYPFAMHLSANRWFQGTRRMLCSEARFAVAHVVPQVDYHAWPVKEAANAL